MRQEYACPITLTAPSGSLVPCSQRVLNESKAAAPELGGDKSLSSVHDCSLSLQEPPATPRGDKRANKDWPQHMTLAMLL